MNILWAGGEDIDFVTFGGMKVSTTSGQFRSGWARCAINMTNGGTDPGNARSYPFTAGAVTSAWLSCHSFLTGGQVMATEGLFLVGFGSSASGSYLGLFTGPTTSPQLSLGYYNGTSVTILATEAGTSYGTLSATGGGKVDFQVSNLGATSTMNVYVNNSLIISFSGSAVITGLTNFDSIVMGVYTGGTATTWSWSELLVADSDTRALLGVNTLALTGAGTTTGWTNSTFTNINGVTLSDTNATFVNTTSADQEYTVGTVQPTVCSVIGVIISVRAAVSSGSTPTHVKLGYGSSGTGFFGTGAQKTPTLGFAQYQQIDLINPITSSAWSQANLTAPLQLDIQSA
jgi:hypothetical protein